MLIYSLLFLLLSNAVTLRRDKSILYSRIAMTIFIYCSAIGLQINILDLKDGIGLFSGLFNVTSITHTFQIFIFYVAIIILQLTGFFPRKLIIKTIRKLFSKTYATRISILNKMSEQYTIVEYPLIIVFIMVGAIFLMSSSDIVSIFIAIELQSYGLYLLCAVYKNSESSTSASLMYFLLGGLSSCIIILGTSLLYVNYGTTSLDSYYLISNILDMAQQTNKNPILPYNITYINLSLVVMSIGFLFKISAAPFHFWSPDVYDAIPTVVTTFVAIIAKISLLVFLLELIYYTSNNYSYVQLNWTYSLLLSSFLSLIVGTILGLNQFRIKKLFAYSTVSHMGFMLLALSINSIESIQAFVFYLMQYSITNLNAFLLLIAIGYTLYFYSSKDFHKLIDKNNSPVQLISQIRGYLKINPMLALSLLITIFSFIGIPPLMGFFAKQMVLSAALNNGYIFITLIAILTSVISAVYYLNLIKQMVFEKSDYKLNYSYKGKLINNLSDMTLSSTLTTTISIFTLFILLFIFGAQEWLSLANLLALILYNK